MMISPVPGDQTIVVHTTIIFAANGIHHAEIRTTRKLTERGVAADMSGPDFQKHDPAANRIVTN